MKKKILVAACAATMILGCSMAVNAAVITEATSEEQTVSSSGWWDAWSDYYALSGNFDVDFTIQNNGGDANWNSVNVIISTAAERGAEGYEEYAVVRMDAYGWGEASLGYKTSWGADWTSYLETMKDAVVNMNIKRVNNNIDIHATINGANGTDLEYDVNVNDYFADDLYLFFAPNASSFVIQNYTINEAPADADSSYVLDPSGWWMDFSPYYSYTGDFTKTFHIDNKGGAAQWNNPIFVVTNQHRNTDGYVEYMVARSDAYAVASASTSTVTYEGTYSQYSWDEIIEILKDASIDLTVSRSGNTVTFSENVVGSNGNSFTYVVKLVDETLPENIYFFLSTDTAKMTVYEDTKDCDNDVTTYAQYKKVADNNYTVRIVSEVALSEDDITSYSRVGFRCSKLASQVGDNYFGKNIYKSIKANGETKTAADGKYFVVLEIKNVTADAVLYVQPLSETATAVDTMGNEVTVNMANILN